MVIIMWKWVSGKRNILKKKRKEEVKIDIIVEKMEKRKKKIVKGKEVLMKGDKKREKNEMMKRMKNYKVMKEKNVILKVVKE